MNEWSAGRRHLHLLLRTDVTLDSGVVASLWRQSAEGAASCEQARNPEGLARYLVKCLKDNRKKELPPADFHGKLFSSSKGFLIRPMKALQKEVLQKWKEKRFREG
jgi:hypothetical protein